MESTSSKWPETNLSGGFTFEWQKKPIENISILILWANRWSAFRNYSLRTSPHSPSWWFDGLELVKEIRQSRNINRCDEAIPQMFCVIGRVACIWYARRSVDCSALVQSDEKKQACEYSEWEIVSSFFFFEKLFASRLHSFSHILVLVFVGKPLDEIDSFSWYCPLRDDHIRVLGGHHNGDAFYLPLSTT